MLRSLLLVLPLGFGLVAAETNAAAAEAVQAYQARCAVCHGRDGDGSRHPKARNYQDPAWQAQVTDEQIKQAISKGVPPMMPPAADIAGKPQLLAEMVKLIRSFVKKENVEPLSE
jgi:cytochrome c553